MRTTLAALALLAAAAAGPAPAAEFDPALLAGLKARAIGPAGMSGRVAAIEAVESDPDVLFVGAATGGVWKSTNGGLTWTPIFDDQPVAAIGAVAVFQLNPDVVWVGTGEGNPRNSASVGNGVYRSLDGGKTWKHLGLDASERVHRIVLHPSDPDVAYVAALGQAWGENPERGVFKTVNGGRTWQKVLYVDDKTGAADLVMDPANPDKLFAALWQYRRWPWFFRSGGPGSGLHVTHDGGATWERLTEDDGLPKGELGRIGIAICRGYPQVVYALVEAEESALVRSDDGGRTWRAVNTEPDVANRPFYYADLRVDPGWPNRVYDLQTRARVSEDGGKSFALLGRSREIHGDYHALWINPHDPTHLVIGNDGGLAVSRDRGETWRFVETLPLAQYYHVAVDMERPYNIYGGLQDNGSWRGPSAVRSQRGGIPNRRWVRVGGGDGFDTRPDPEDPMQGYAMSQGGNLMRWNLSTGESKPIKPPQPGEEELRFNWNAALAIDPFDPATIYYGSQYVHKSTDRGRSWSTASPDLTTDNREWQKQRESGGLTPDITGAENFTTLLAIAPSPVQRGVIWAGSDDGRLHLTRDGGATWESLEKRVPGVPASTWIPHVEPSRFDAAEAFVVFDDHRRSNWTPYVVRTRDWGRTWTSLVTRDLRGYALSIVQDPVDRDLLFLGTEFGLWVSTDGGRRWMRWTHGVPTVSVMDLAIHPREHDLVLGTHGRALYVIDDISPLRRLGEAAGKPVHLFAVPAATQAFPEPAAGGGGLGAGEFQGENRPSGALLTYWLDIEGLPHPDAEVERGRREERRRVGKPAAAEEPKEAAPGAGPRGRGKKSDEPQVAIEIRRGEETVRKLEAPARLGLNRVAWDLGREPFKRPPGEEVPFFLEGRSGPQVPPGTYEVVVRYREHEARGTVEVLADPAARLSEADWQAREGAIRRAGALQETLVAAVERLVRAAADVEVVVRLASEKKDGDGGGDEGGQGEGGHADLLAAARKLGKRLREVEAKLRVPPKTKGIVRRLEVNSFISTAMQSLGSSWEAPTPTDLAYLDIAERRLAAGLEEVNRLFADEVAPFREQVEAAGLTLLPEEEPLSVGGQ